MPTDECPSIRQSGSAPKFSRATTMSIRVTRTTDTGKTVLKIDGRLQSQDIGEVEEEQRSVRGPLVLELTNLQSADAAGITMLRRMTQEGARIQGASPYIELLLGEKSNASGW